MVFKTLRANITPCNLKRIMQIILLISTKYKKGEVEYMPVEQSHENDFQKDIPVFKCIPCRLQVTFQDGKSCVQARAGERGQRKRRRMQRR